MKIIALQGSPKSRGNTGLLLEAAVQGAREAGAAVEVMKLNSLNIKPCQGCNSCFKTGACIYKDDMQKLYQAFDLAGGFIISSPVYFASVSAQLKGAIDRCQAYWSARYVAGTRPKRIKKRPGIFLSAAGLPDGKGNRFTPALEVVKTLGYALDMELTATILAAGTDHTPVAEDSPLIEQAYQAGRSLTLALKGIP